jgi:Trp operon repressor
MATIPIRKECPPGACVCQRDTLLADPQADLRILQLTKEEEKRLLERLESLQTLADLQRMQHKLQAQLGIVLTIASGATGEASMRGFDIQVADQPGLCRKTREAIPAAVRRCMKATPAIAVAFLDADGLWGAS